MNKIKIKPKTFILTAVLIVILILIFWIFSRWQINNPVQLTNLLNQSGNLVSPNTTRLPNKDIFTNSLEQDGRWRQLKDFRTEDVVIGETGRSNPFFKP